MSKGTPVAANEGEVFVSMLEPRASEAGGG